MATKSKYLTATLVEHTARKPVVEAIRLIADGDGFQYDINVRVSGSDDHRTFFAHQRFSKPSYDFHKPRSFTSAWIDTDAQASQLRSYLLWLRDQHILKDRPLIEHYLQDGAGSLLVVFYRLDDDMLGVQRVSSIKLLVPAALQLTYTAALKGDRYVAESRFGRCEILLKGTAPLDQPHFFFPVRQYFFHHVSTETKH